MTAISVSSLLCLVARADRTAFDPVTGAIYCGQCNDLIISDTFDELFLAYSTEAEEGQDHCRDLKGRTRGKMKYWSPAPEERKAVMENFTKSSCRGKLPLSLTQTSS